MVSDNTGRIRDNDQRTISSIHQYSIQIDSLDFFAPMCYACNRRIVAVLYDRR